MQNELIIVSEYCDKCHIEPSFIEMLQEIGLIDIRTEGGERCLQFAQLPDASVSGYTKNCCKQLKMIGYENQMSGTLRQGGRMR